jgi:hypothetical protein
MEGYTTIEIEGQQIGLFFGLYAVQLIHEKLAGMSADLGKENSRINAKVFKHILYSGYLCDCDAMETEPTLTMRDFQMWIEKNAKDGTMDQVTAAVLVYNKSVEVKPSKNGEATESEKKNLLIGTE